MNKITKENGYKETELGPLPNEWKVVDLNDYTELNDSGVWGEEVKKGDFGTEVLRSTNIQNDNWVFSDVAKRKITKNQFKKYWLKEGDILVTKSSGSKFHIGKAAYVTKEVEDRKAIFANFMQRIRLNSFFSPKFAFFYITSSQGKKQLLKRSTTTTGLRNLRKKDFDNLILPLPPLEEQKKIAGVLSAVQDAIEKTEAVIQATKDLKKSMMKHLFTYGPVPLSEKENVPLKETEIGMIPEECRIVKLNDLAKKITDGAHKTPTYTENGIPFLRVLDIQQENINWSKTKKIPYEEHNDLIKRCKPEEGDILLSKNGTIGVTKVVDWNKKFSIFVSLCLIKPIHELVNNRYLSYYLSSTGLEQIKKRTKRMTVTNLHLVEIRTLLIPIFTLSKQKKIVDILSSLDNKIQGEENKKKALEDLFNSLLHNLMTAKIRVNDLDLEGVEI